LAYEEPLYLYGNDANKSLLLLFHSCIMTGLSCIQAKGDRIPTQGAASATKRQTDKKQADKKGNSYMPVYNIICLLLPSYNVINTILILITSNRQGKG
jgi:hypothetical protein